MTGGGSSDKRKIFNLKNLSEHRLISKTHFQKGTNCFEQSISACGVLFYRRIDETNIDVLVIAYDDPNWPRLDDFGGQIDEDDATVIDAIARETSEESNNVLTKEFVHELLSGSSSFSAPVFFYYPKGKYYHAVMEVELAFYPHTEVFGNHELVDNIGRVLKWVPWSEAKENLAYRLCGDEPFMTYMNNLVTAQAVDAADNTVVEV